jgi:CheY-like chemotaxis protein
VTARQLRRGAGQMVLVVEDSPSLAIVAGNILLSLGYTPIVVGDGPAALAELERTNAIELLLTDVILPKGMTGFDVARAARRLRPNLPVIFVSGFSDQSLVSEDFGRETRLLSKPFRIAELAEALAAAFERGGVA